MIPDAYFMLFILSCAYKLAENDAQRYRVIVDLRQEVDTLQAQGLNELPAYVTEILKALTP